MVYKRASTDSAYRKPSCVLPHIPVTNTDVSSHNCLILRTLYNDWRLGGMDQWRLSSFLVTTLGFFQTSGKPSLVIFHHTRPTMNGIKLKMVYVPAFKVGERAEPEERQDKTDRAQRQRAE